MELKKNPNVDVGRNSSLYFAVGLNVMLVFSYLAMEYKTYDRNTLTADMLSLSDEFKEEIPITNLEFKPPPPPAPKITEAIKVVEDIKDIEETFFESTETGQDDVIEKNVQIEDVAVEEVEEDIEVPFFKIEKVPTFPGCTGTNEELKVCFQEKLNEHIKNNFKYPEVAQELNIHGRVFVFFLIDKTGKITNIQTRGPDKVLEEEACRIVNLLPQMEPGRQRDRPVGVPYSLPINFKLVL